jgi:hypothetical protein
MKAFYMHAFAYFRMASAPQVTSRPDVRCRRLPLPPHLCGPMIPKAFQTRMRVMLMLSVASSLSFEFDNLHRLITNWTCVPLPQQAIAAMGAPSSMEHLLPPLKSPKVISQESRKAYEQVLTSVDEGYLQTGVEHWRGLFPSKLKTVPKVKASTLNLNDVKGGEGLNIFFRAEVVASTSFMKEFRFNSGIWSEQKFQIANEMRAVFANKDLSHKTTRRRLGRCR